MEHNSNLESAILTALSEASLYGVTELTDDILFYIIYRDESYGIIKKTLYAASISSYELKTLLNTLYDMQPNAEKREVPYSQETLNTLAKAEEYAVLTDSDILETPHVLLALLDSPNEILQNYYNDHNADLDALRKDLIEYIYTSNVSRLYTKDVRKTTTKQIPKPLKDQCEDLVQQALDGEIDPLIGREKEIEAIINTLSRRTKNNVLLLGDSGTGKTAIVKGLALKIANGEIPALANKRIFSLNLGSLMTNTTYRGQLESKLTELVQALVQYGDCILFIDEMHTVIGTGTSSDNKTDIAQLLKPHLTGRKLQLIGATTLAEAKTIEKDAAFARRLNFVTIEEPNEEDTLNIIKNLAYKYEDFHEVQMPEETLKAVVRLSGRYIQDRHQPDKSIDILDEAAARLKLNNANRKISRRDQILLDIESNENKLEEATDLYEIVKIRKLLVDLENEYEELDSSETNSVDDVWPILTVDDIAKIIESRTGIPVSKLMQSDKQRLLKLEEELHKQVVGQDQAVKAVANAVRRNSSGINDPKKPIASFIFAGPSGVGKTELAKALADLQFGSRDNIIRLDCSEYKEEHSLSKILGAPAGYVGHGSGGTITEAVRRQPYSVILVDELEKAHPNFSDILLQILDEGQLTDAEGTKVSFKNCIIIITTNLGSGLVSQSRPVGFGSNDTEENEQNEYEALRDKTMETIKKSLRPELINRLDDIVVFHSLSKAHLRDIARILGKDLDKRLEDQDIVVRCSDDALDYISDFGYNPVYGARPLKRAITTHLEEPLSLMLLEDKIKEGDVIQVELEDGALVFYKVLGEDMILVTPKLVGSEA